ncbi:MAG: hypothetical protein AAFU77_01770 [Myxococcota bacterium]
MATERDWQTLLQQADFRIRLLVGDRSTLELTGVLRESAPSELIVPALERLESCRSKRFLIDMSSLHYMNAGCFRVIASWLKKVSARGDVQLSVRTSASQRWQVLMMPALRAVVGPGLESELVE